MKNITKLMALCLCAVMTAAAVFCGPAWGRAAAESAAGAPGNKNGDVMILYTSDIHCGVEQGFGLAGLLQVRKALEEQGYTTLLVDDGDAIQGELMGTVSRGESMIRLMNAMGYDAAIPGNHEFDYGADRFLELAGEAEFPYICCNLFRDGERVFPAYVIREAAGLRIAFVGVTTPESLTSSTPKYFRDENGEFIYDFLMDESGERLYAAVQEAVDEARAEGADLVYVLAHLGMSAASAPYTYADLISHTNGIDVLLDGHSHDTEQVTMKNKDGDTVARSACGTKMECIGYSRISAGGGVAETGIWSWPNKTPAAELLGIHNEISGAIENETIAIKKMTDTVIARSDAKLTIADPVEKDASGNPVRMVRRAETNLGDFVTDAIREQTGADIGICGGGGIRTDLERGEITYGHILAVFPFQNQVAVIRATGKQVLDALEWGARAVPDENGGFLQVSGLSYVIDVSIPSGCRKDEKGMMSGIEGERRVRDVTVNGEPLDPEKTYTIASTDYIILNNGDGFTAFEGAEVLQDQFKLDSQTLIDHIVHDLDGVIGGEYADPYGQGRIVIVGQ
ncbi:MAG: bifunctional metallophosphatase/5'-nucleotidase [Clostridia bacterium]|nr:bifunctional metallophosphatase/5'-nucleotidase [Clostridia bacterium]